MFKHIQFRAEENPNLGKEIWTGYTLIYLYRILAFPMEIMNAICQFKESLFIQAISFGNSLSL